MATALAPALQPALAANPDWAAGQNTGQQIGAEGRDASDIGVPATEPDWGTGPLLTGAQPSGSAGVIESSGIDYLGAEYQGTYPDQTPWPDYQGDPDRPADSPIAMGGHDWDQGAPAALRTVGQPDTGDPVLQTFETQSTERQPVYASNGEMIEVPGTRTAPGFNAFNNRDVGYTYMQESERPFYVNIAEVPPEYGPAGGLYQPDDTYSEMVYNDGGIPPAYVTPPDPPVNTTPAPAEFVTDDIGYGASY